MAKSNYKLNWQGATTREQVVAAVIGGLTEFGLTHEREAKSELIKGRGVVTGTLRRSIHSAPPEYDYTGDNVPPSPNAPERGGGAGELRENAGKVTVIVGSGMNYAETIEKLYGYMRASHDRIIGGLPAILEKHAERNGLK